MSDFREKMKIIKNTIIDKEYVKIKKVMEFQSKMKWLFNEVNTFAKSYQILEKENNNLRGEVKALTTGNQSLKWVITLKII